MTQFGPMKDLFSNHEDRIRLLESRKIKLSKLDSFNNNEKAFYESVSVARASMQRQNNVAQTDTTSSPSVASLKADNRATMTRTNIVNDSESTPSSAPTVLSPASTPSSVSAVSAVPAVSTTSPPPTPLTFSEDVENRINTVANELNVKDKAGLAGNEGLAKSDSSVFSNLVDVINPLQHIPFVNLAYREITGDQISQGGKVIGGTLFGGLLGGVGSIAMAGSAIGFSSGVADATFSNVSGVETSVAAGKLYRGEKFYSNEQSQKNLASTKKIEKSNTPTQKVTFDARHVYADVLQRFGVEIDVLLAHNHNYGAEVIYADSLARVNSMSAEDLSSLAKTKPTSPKEQLAILHRPLEKGESLAQAPRTESNQTNSILNNADPIAIKNQALERLEMVRKAINSKSAEANVTKSVGDSKANDIASMIERRLSKLIETRSDNPKQIKTSSLDNNHQTSNIVGVTHHSSSQAPVNSQTKSPQFAYPSVSATSLDPQDNINTTDLMQKRLEEFNQRRNQKIDENAINGLVNVDEQVKPSQTPKISESHSVSESHSESSHSASLASAVRDAFARFGRGFVARN